MNFFTSADQLEWLPEAKLNSLNARPRFVREFNSVLFTKDDESQEVIFGENICDSQLGGRAKKLGTHAFLVTDSGLSGAGHPDKLCKILSDSGLRVTLYDRSIENPTDSSAQTCAEVARRSGIDLIIGLGGGSSMDTAKGCNFLLTNGGRMVDYWGIGKVIRKGLDGYRNSRTSIELSC